jgi:F420-dependent oxidoreductase-like protein
MIKFGLQIPNFSYGGPDAEIFDRVLERALAAEESGFDSVWVMDHFFQLPPLGGPDAAMLEAYTTLGALAARTQRVRLGALVTGVTYRNPALLAKITTTLDVISKGRAILGIGAAWYDVEHNALGFDFPPARERLERLEEATRICRAMFTEDRPSFAGKHYRIAEARNVPAPIQAGGPQIMVGGSGEKVTLRIAAQYADMCNFIASPEGTRHKIEVLRKHCAAVGRDPSEISITRLATLVGTEDDAGTEAMRTMLESAVGAEGARSFHIGQPKEIISQIAELADAGVDYFIFNMPMSSPEQISKTGEDLTTHFG